MHRSFPKVFSFADVLSRNHTADPGASSLTITESARHKIEDAMASLRAMEECGGKMVGVTNSSKCAGKCPKNFFIEDVSSCLLYKLMRQKM